MSFRKKISKSYANYKGYSLNKKVVVIESDDWGSIRSLNEGVVKKAMNKGFRLDNKFACYDGLERTTDLEHLFETLSSVKDREDNPAVITALTLTGNPDFDKINLSHGVYEFQELEKTYNYYNEPKLLDFWKKEGINKNLLFPQFHGREHLHPDHWLHVLKEGNGPERFAFENKSIFGLSYASRDNEFLAALEYRSEKEKLIIEERTIDGLALFEKIFGFRSVSFCPPQSIFGPHMHNLLVNNGVRYCQSGQHFEPTPPALMKKNYFWGQSSKECVDLKFWRRNCTFEPYNNLDKDHINSCLKDISIAFRFGKPAVINSHRINYTSRINPRIRDFSLVSLKRLLERILVIWPDVLFINSAQLAAKLDMNLIKS
ncbi:hypothetical protein N9K89_04540 [Schleiferiaceae bacterium]|nr:hypothetical protein [Schleiferiaceae bacterium]